MFSEKTHDTIRKLQLLLGAAGASIGVITAAIDLGKIGLIVSTIIMAASVFCGYLSDHDSRDWKNSVIITPARSPINESEAEG